MGTGQRCPQADPQAHPQACPGCRQWQVPQCIPPQWSCSLCLIQTQQGRHLQSVHLAQVNGTGPVHCPLLWGKPGTPSSLKRMCAVHTMSSRVWKAAQATAELALMHPHRRGKDVTDVLQQQSIVQPRQEGFLYQDVPVLSILQKKHNSTAGTGCPGSTVSPQPQQTTWSQPNHTIRNQ